MVTGNSSLPPTLIGDGAGTIRFNGAAAIFIVIGALKNVALICFGLAASATALARSTAAFLAASAFLLYSAAAAVACSAAVLASRAVLCFAAASAAACSAEDLAVVAVCKSAAVSLAEASALVSASFSVWLSG